MKLKQIIYAVFIVAMAIITFSSCSSDDGNNCTEETWYQDADEDGFGNPNNTQQSCTQPNGYVDDNTDFDDTNATAFPGAEEICNDGIDNDGDGEVDECSSTIEIIGNWTDNFDNSWEFTSSTIRTVTNDGTVYLYTILVNGGNYVICLNDENNAFFAEAYSKLVFTNISANTLNLCQPYFNEATQADIENATDPTNLGDLAEGCGGFAWSLLTRD